MCINILDIWFGITNGQILSIFDNVMYLLPSVFSFPDDIFSKYQWDFTTLGICMCNDNIVDMWFDGSGLKLNDGLLVKL